MIYSYAQLDRLHCLPRLLFTLLHGERGVQLLWHPVDHSHRAKRSWSLSTLDDSIAYHSNIQVDLHKQCPLVVICSRQHRPGEVASCFLHRAIHCLVPRHLVTIALILLTRSPELLQRWEFRCTDVTTIEHALVDITTIEHAPVCSDATC